MKNIAIITGTSSGIGEAILRLAASSESPLVGEQYDELWAIARRSDKLDSIIEEIGDNRVIPLIGDITNQAFVENLQARLQGGEYSIGLLVNCAGMGVKGTVISKSTEAIRDTLEVNCIALGVLTRVCLPYMRGEGHGRIINIASSAGFLPQPGFACYAASKSFVISFSRALGAELKSSGVSVTAVCPGPVCTDFQRKATGGKSSEFTGFRKAVAADPKKLAMAALRASAKRRSLLVYKVSQKALHVVSKIIPTGLILFFEKKALKGQ